MEIKEALASLDPANDDHWTADGLPKMELVKSLVGQPLTRQEVVDADPQFSRESARLAAAAALEAKGGDDDEEEGLREGEGDEEVDLSSVISEILNAKGRDLERLVAGYEIEDLREIADIMSKGALGRVREINAMKESLEHIQRRQQYVRAVLDSKMPRNQTMLDIQAHIQTQNALRAQRFAEAAAIREKLGLPSADPRSPIDAAMARKNKRGGQRPVRI